MPLSRINPNFWPSVDFGTDPEGFFSRSDGSIIGAEKIIPKKGLEGWFFYPEPSKPHGGPRVVLDGVQFELVVEAGPCRAEVGNDIAKTMRDLQHHLRSYPGVKVDFRSSVEVSREELDSLDKQSRVLGCQPSKNLYDTKIGIGVDPETYLKRSAGGHIHQGLYEPIYTSPSRRSLHGTMDERERLVMLDDVLVGLVFTLIDRDPGAAERRKVYGRAGEYRTPLHGLEYRTLSNCWLRSYQLMSLAFGLTRMAAGTLSMTLNSLGDYEDALMHDVDVMKVRQAINESDLPLALEQFEHVKRFITDHIKPYDHNVGLNPRFLKKFDTFVKGIWSDGIERWFPGDPLDNWANMPEGHDNGWETWLDSKVHA